ncbi:MAG: TonB-dependent receptor [Gammaproteobacteria bacterium]|nr:MAG: TonB-dependent receptor [Gammaproteobacteria bacterium]
MPSLRTLPVLIALTLSPSLAFSETTLMLDELVVTGTRSETSLMDLAGNTDTVEQEEIDLLNADHIEESLLRIPGMNLQRGNGVEMTIALRSPVLTGPGAGGAFLFMEDGIALRSAAFGNNNGLSEAHYEQAGAIEVVRGPGSALYGSNAVHGLVNVLSRDPSEELERKIDLTLGSDDLYKIRGTVSDTVGAHAYRFSFSGVDDGGWRDDSGLGQQKITARHDYFSENGDTFKTVFSAFNVNQETAGFITSETDDHLYERGSDVIEANASEDGYRDWWSVRLSTRWDHEFSNGHTFSFTPYARSTEMKFRQHYLPSRAIEENGHDSIGAQTAYYIDLDGGHKVIFGTDFEYTDGHLKETQERASYSYFGKNRQQGIHYDYDVEAVSISPYVHAEWQLAEKLRATTGLRFDHTSYDYNNNVADGTGMADGSACFSGSDCLYQRPADREDTFNDWSPKLGLVYRVAEAHSLFSNLSRGHRAPQTTDLYRIQKDQIVGETDSEQADSLEVGARGSLEQFGLNYEVSAYYMKKKNFFFRDSFGNSVTDAKTKHRGIEVSLSMPLGEQFDIAANYTHAVHTYDSNHAAKSSLASEEIKRGSEIDTAPKNIANVRLGWNFKADSRAELEWSHMGNYYTSPDNSAKYEGHDLFNLRVNTQVTTGLALHAQIKNLFDTEYADRADYAFGDYRFFPGRDRHYEVGASYNF